MDAIQKDASEKVETPKDGTDVNEKPVTQAEVKTETDVSTNKEPVKILERDSMVNELVKKQRELRSGTVEEDQVPPVSDDAVVVDVIKSDKHDEPADAEIDAIDDELVELKVNGQQMFRTKKEVEDAGGIPAIQKQISGDMKLQAAAQRQRDLDRREQEIAEKERKLKESQNIQPAAKKPSTIDTKALAESMVLGDTTKVAEAIEAIVTAATTPVVVQQQQSAPVDTVAIKNDVKKDLKYDQDLEDARADFKTKFSDVYNHPGNRMLANEETKKLQVEHPEWSPSEILIEAGRRTRAVIRSAVKQGGKELTPLEQKRLAKKQSVDQIPQAHTRGHAPPIDEHKPKTKAEIFAEMEASRSH